MSAGGGPPRDRQAPADAVELWSALADAQDRALAERQADQTLARSATEALLRAQGTVEQAEGQGAARAARTSRRVIVLSAAGGAALAAAAVLLLMPLRAGRAPVEQTQATLRFQIADGQDDGQDGQDSPKTMDGQVGQPLHADARSELPLRFSDGSQVIFLPGSSGQVDRLTGHGAEVALQRGRLDVSVVHAPRTRWVVQAGPFRVLVTGTRFRVDWSPDQQLTVALHEGSVVVGGSLLGEGVPLRAGQRLRVAVASGQVRTDEFEFGALETADLPPPEVQGAAPATTAPVAAMAPAAPVAAMAGWRALAERGQYDRALQAAEREGLERLSRSLSARELLRLADVARYAGRPEPARHLFRALVARFPDDRLAADAVFSLGRLEFEAGQPAVAATWFDRYLRDWPNGPLAEQAAVRLLERGYAATGPGSAGLARRAAAHYLRLSPDGVHVGRARALLQAGEAPSESQQPEPRP